MAMPNANDLLVEELITPAEATAMYSRGPRGRKVHVGRVHRDMQVGIRNVVLESISTPRLATSRQALARFFLRLSETARPAAPTVASAPRSGRTSGSVDRELDQLGF